MSGNIRILNPDRFKTDDQIKLAPNVEPEDLHPTLRLFCNLDNGRFLDRFLEAYTEAVDATRAKLKKSTVNVSIVFDLEHKDDPSEVQCIDTISTKLPAGRSGRATLFAIADGQLTSDNPRQTNFGDFLAGQDRKAREYQPVEREPKPIQGMDD